MTNPDESAYPTCGNYDGHILPDGGFTKREIVLKDFMKELLHNYRFDEDANVYAQQAAKLTEAYFNELNKQQ